MQKIFKVLYRFKILLLIAVIFSIQGCFFKGFGQSESIHNKIRTIVIDAGHGGKDPGALGKHSKEKDIVLAISLKIGKYIEEKIPDIEVIYTRKSDVFIPLHERSKIANDANADLFISIHANSNPNKKAYGTETFAMGLHKTEENLKVAKKENSVIVFEDNYEVTYEGFDPNDIESYIMMSLMQDTYLEQSLNAASYIQNQFRERTKRKDRGVKQAGFLVLWETSMPSVLIEVGFVSNLTEEKFLISEQGQDYLASAIYRAFCNYINYIEGDEKNELIASSEKEEKPTLQHNLAIINKTDTISNTTSEIKDTTNKQIISIEEEKPENVIYKVQIIYSESKIDIGHSIFSDFNDVEEITVDGTYKYVVGAKKNYPDALEYSKWVKSRHPDAFVVAISGGKIIPLSKALSMYDKN